MKRSYKYLKDTAFLEKVDTDRQQTQYVKITLLDWNEKEIQEIQGIVTGGTISINGDSSVRRTCNLSMFVDETNMKITNPSNLISINKKVFLEIGLKNNTNLYKDYDIIWFPQGTYAVTACSSSHSTGGTTLSINLQDKMCLLNGTCGGVIPSSVEFHKYETIDALTGEYITSYPTIVQIIRELVNHWGNEQLGKIIISDIDERIKVAMRWIGDDPVYAITKNGSYILTTSKSEAEDSGDKFSLSTDGTLSGPETPTVNADGILEYPSELEMTSSGSMRIKSKNYVTYEWGEDIGYTYTDFTYPGELIANPGDNVCTILDKIKSTLGNFEYFYDVDGNFHFQEIKNYLNTTQATTDLEAMKKEDYLVDISKGTAAYSFKDSSLVTNYSNSPNYTNIKNDYVVWGIRENSEGIKVPIRYHLAIDSKPTPGNIYEVFFFTDPDDGLIKAKVPVKYKSKSNFPKQGSAGVFYMDLSSGVIYLWDGELMDYTIVSNGVVQTYSSKSDFPETGTQGIVYLDSSTSTNYSWSLNSKSDHYQTIQTQIDALAKDYMNNSKEIETNIEDVNAEIAEKEDDLDAITQTTSPLLEKIAKAQTDLTNVETGITKNENQADLAQEEYDYDIEQQPLVQEKVEDLTDELNELKKKNKLTATGKYIELTNAEDAEIHSISFAGYLKQDTTPSWDNPQTINALTGNINITANVGTKSNSLVYSLGTTKMFAEDILTDGTLTQQYGHYTLEGAEIWTATAASDYTTFTTTIDNLAEGKEGNVISNYFTDATVVGKVVTIKMPISSGITTADKFNQWIIECTYTKAKAIDLYYPLATAATVTIPSTGILTTYNPNTYISSDEDITMTIIYESNVYTDEINDTTLELKKAQTVLDELNRSIAILPGQIQTYLDIIEDLKLEKSVLESNISGYQALLDPKEQQIQELKDEIAGLQTQLDNLYTSADLLLETFNSQKKELESKQYEYVETSLVEMQKVKTTDWRSELYLQGAAAEPLGTESNYYYTELSAEWPKIYDLRKSHYEDESGNIVYTGGFIDDVLNNPSIMDYFLDFIDSNAAISQYNVSNIGRRSMVENKDDYNCVFEPYIPDYVIIETGQDDTAEKRAECEARGQAYIQVEPAIFNSIATGGASNGCFEEVKMLLYNYTGYNESIQLSTIPLYHLDVNKRVEVRDIESDINGDYVINSISIPLTINGTMSISATRAAEKL